MKTAVFVYGEYRDFDIVVKTWDFLKDLDCDVYVSTWDYSCQKNEILGYFVEKNVTKEMILDYVPNAKIMITNEKKHYGNEHYNVYPPEKVIFHSKNCLDIAKDSGIKYDQIIWTRTDNYTKFNFTRDEFYNMNKLDRIYGLSHIFLSSVNEFFVNDVFFISNYNVISNLIDKLPLHMTRFHEDLASHIIKLNLFVEQIGHKIEFCTVRGNIGELNEDELLNMADVFRITNLWNNSQDLKE
jgi:hypothetical protein